MAEKNKKSGFKEYDILKLEHPFPDIYSTLSEYREGWLSKRELGLAFKQKIGQKITSKNLDYFLRWSRKKGIVQHRIRELKPLKGFTAADVLKKLEVGANRMNTGVAVYEYKITDKDAGPIFDFLVQDGRKKKLGLGKKKKSEWNKQRRLSPAEALYVKYNPDGLSLHALSKMMSVYPMVIDGIQKGKTYRDLDMAKHTPMREEMFNQVKTKHWDFFEKNLL